MKTEVYLARPDDRRILAAVRAVLPPAADITLLGRRGELTRLSIGKRRVSAAWMGHGWLHEARKLVGAPTRPDIVVARRMSEGARAVLAEQRISWADEMGAAEIAVGDLIVSRSGQPPERRSEPSGWTPAVAAVAEALLCDVDATVAATHEATGLSTGSVVSALRVLAGLGLLTSSKARGPSSKRTVVDRDELLHAYAMEAASLRPRASLVVGASWRDAVDGVRKLGRRWNADGTTWAATGAVAADVLAPLVTSVGSAEVYVDARTIADLEALARRNGMTPLQGGRLTLRPFPTTTTRLLAAPHDGVSIAPWPRVYADVRTSGVRGEEAAEHLREVMHGR